jgi:hypothetical protein
MWKSEATRSSNVKFKRLNFRRRIPTSWLSYINYISLSLKQVREIDCEEITELNCLWLCPMAGFVITSKAVETSLSAVGEVFI